MKQLYQIADLIVEMDVTGKTFLNAKPYHCINKQSADIHITCKVEEWMRCNPHIDLDTAQYIATNKDFFKKLLAHEGFGLHASTVCCRNRAYLFAAPSGTGKSTHTSKWVRLFQATILNDDTPAIRRRDGRWYAYGTPWSGKGENTNEKASIGGIAFLQRGDANRMERISSSQAFRLIFNQTLHWLGAQEMKAQWDLVASFVSEVPTWKLTCRDDDAAALLSYQEMLGEEHEEIRNTNAGIGRMDVTGT